MTKNPNSGADDGLPTIAQLCDRMIAAQDAVSAYEAEVNKWPHSQKAIDAGIWTPERMARLNERQTAVSEIGRQIDLHPDAHLVQRTNGRVVGMRKNSPTLSEESQYLANLEAQAKRPVAPNLFRRGSFPRPNLNQVFDPETATARGEPLTLDGALPMSDSTPEAEISTVQALDNFTNDAYRLAVLLDCAVFKVSGSEGGALVGLASELALDLKERIQKRTTLEMRREDEAA